MNPAIVIPCYQRHFSLQRLLDSISVAHYPEGSIIPLIISLEGGATNKVIEVATNFEWKFGPKKIIERTTPLGLKQHIFQCTDLVSEYENIIILEDDLFVSPYFYQFAIEAGSFYREDRRVAGISLYNYPVSEFSNQPFCPLDDGSDVYFLQLPSSWGQLFTREGWKDFREWNSKNEHLIGSSNISREVKEWGNNSWKKHFVHYMVTNDLYFVFPRRSLTTNFEELGSNSDASGKYQSFLQNVDEVYRFYSMDESRSVYDAYFEITSQSLNKWVPLLKNYNYEVDLNGTKNSFINEYVLSFQESSSPEKTFSGQLKPPLQNVISNLDGNEITFSRVDLLRERNRSLNAINKFFLVIPVVDYREEALIKTVESIIYNSYSNRKLVICISEEFEERVNHLIESKFFKNRFDMYFIVSKFGSLAECLTFAFKKLKSGIVGWLEPGAVLPKDQLTLLNKSFELSQVNSVVVISPDQPLDNYRFNKENVLYLINEGMEINPGLIFFRGGRWDQIDPFIRLSRPGNSAFFSNFILALVYRLNLYPMVIPGSDQDQQPSVRLEKWTWDHISTLNKILPDLPRSYQSGKRKFKVCKWFLNKGIPGLKNLYGTNYNLPLVIRVDPDTQSVFFSNR